MKSILSSFLVSLSLLLFSCEAVDPTYSDISDYFPLAVGNYWVYDREVSTDASSNIVHLTDSLVIVDYQVKDGADLFKIEYYVDGSLIVAKNILKTEDGGNLYGTIDYVPILADYYICNTCDDSKLPFLHKSAKKDSVIYMVEYPSRLANGDTIVTVTKIVNNYDYHNLSTKPIQFESSQRKKLTNRISGKGYLALIEPDYVKLQPDPKSRYCYTEDMRMVYLPDYDFTNEFIEDVGIFSSEQIIKLCNESEIHKRKLLRYRVNK